MSEHVLEKNEFAVLLELCKENHFTLGSVESITGGLFSSNVCSVPGASKCFKGGLVTYAVSQKTKLADVNISLIDRYGVVSTQVAKAMAKGGAKKMECDIVISFTGNAGPELLDGKPLGRVAIGYYICGKVYAEEITLSGSRNEIRHNTTTYGAIRLIQFIREYLTQSRK